jgi:hypothetical protein
MQSVLYAVIIVLGSEAFIQEGNWSFHQNNVLGI